MRLHYGLRLISPSQFNLTPGTSSGKPGSTMSDGYSSTTAILLTSTPPCRPAYIFLQFMNPEICSLYGVRNNWHSKQLHKEWVQLAKYAVLISTHGLVVPASYLFEIKSIDGFLKELSPVRAAGLFHLASATSDLVEYAADKRREYRDEKQFHAKYQNAE